MNIEHALSVCTRLLNVVQAKASIVDVIRRFYGIGVKSEPEGSNAAGYNAIHR